MDHERINAIFQPKPSKQEAKADATTQIVRQITNSETAAREAKTERLRLARLAKQKSEPAAPAKPTARQRKKA
ncbi:MAG: hypothetical protein ACTHKQ_07830 [Mesorhizobium sp.]